MNTTINDQNDQTLEQQAAEADARLHEVRSRYQAAWTRHVAARSALIHLVLYTPGSVNTDCSNPFGVLSREEFRVLREGRERAAQEAWWDFQDAERDAYMADADIKFPRKP